MQPAGSWQPQFDAKVAPAAGLLVAAGQVAMVNEVNAFQTTMMQELGLAAPAPVIAESFAGMTGDGRTVTGLLAQTVPHAGRRYDFLIGEQDPKSLTQSGQLHTARAALEDTARWLDRYVATILGDTQKAAAQTSMAAGETTKWVRAVNLPCCGRCAILAGRVYRWDANFLRHPQCDCYAIPVAENTSHSPATNMNDLFDQMTPAEQDAAFTIAGAEAIRAGADPVQVVNARRGMSTPNAPTTGSTGRLTPGGILDQVRDNRTDLSADQQRDLIRSLLIQHGYIRA